MSVADLAGELERWYDNILFCCAWFDHEQRQTGRCKPPSWDDDPKYVRLWWEAWKVLRGGGVLTAAMRGQLPPHLREAAYARYGRTFER